MNATKFKKPRTPRGLPGYTLMVMECYDRVKKILGTKTKAKKWIMTDNPQLGCTPYVLIGLGRGDKVLKFIKVCEEENQR